MVKMIILGVLVIAVTLSTFGFVASASETNRAFEDYLSSSPFQPPM